MGKLRHEFDRQFRTQTIDDHTLRTYHEGIDRFSDFLKTEGISEREALREAKGNNSDLPQRFYNWMTEEKGYRSTTAHTYITSVCKLFHLNMDSIVKLPRISAHTVKGRIEEKNHRGKTEAGMERYRRIVSFASSVGIRRAEYGRLYGRDIRYDASGLPVAVWVESGKGGKSTEQLILPSHRQAVLEVVKDVGPNEKIFSHKEMSLRTDLHAFRREIARESYNFFLSLPPESRQKLKDSLIKSFSTQKKGVTPKQIDKFTKEVTLNRPYYLRGNNLEKALRENKPTSYDRLSMYGCAFYTLSHFRLDVTLLYLQ